MKNVHVMTKEIISGLPYLTSFEETKILILVDRIYSKPWINHRLELICYSLKYKAEDKSIYVYSKEYDNNDNFDFDCSDIIEFPIDFNLKFHTDDAFTNIINKIKLFYNKIKGVK